MLTHIHAQTHNYRLFTQARAYRQAQEHMHTHTQTLINTNPLTITLTYTLMLTYTLAHILIPTNSPYCKHHYFVHLRWNTDKSLE